MERWKGKVAVITGTSSGIGKELARCFVAKGLQVVGLARRAKYIDKLSKELSNSPGMLHPIQADIMKKEDIANAFETIKNKFGRVNILINNAGVARFGSIIDGNVQDWRNILHTNVLGLAIVTREALKLMDDDSLRPHIVNINSVAGQRIFIRSSMYGASKHAVTNLTNVLRDDLKRAGRKINVTSISPGAVFSNVSDNAVLLRYPSMRVDHFVEVVVFALTAPSTTEVQEIIVEHPDSNFLPTNNY